MVRTWTLNAVCQHYRLRKLTLSTGKAFVFDEECVAVLPTSLWTASLMKEKDGLFAPMSLLIHGEVKELSYTLTAWSDDDCVQEDFRHPIEHKLILAKGDNLSRKGSVKLFTKDSLNLVLRTKAFPGVRCLQFVC